MRLGHAGIIGTWGVSLPQQKETHIFRLAHTKVILKQRVFIGDLKSSFEIDEDAPDLVLTTDTIFLQRNYRHFTSAQGLRFSPIFVILLFGVRIVPMRFVAIPCGVGFWV